MRYALVFILLVSNAHAINRDQLRSLQDGEDEADVLVYKKRKQVTVSECSSSVQCKLDEVCYRASDADPKGICVKKPKD